jgi:hypothetical protein
MSSEDFAWKVAHKYARESGHYLGFLRFLEENISDLDKDQIKRHLISHLDEYDSDRVKTSK